MDVLCFGEALVDLLPDRRGRLRDSERFEVHSGGAPSNVAVGLSRLGLKVGFRGVLGDDEFGHALIRKLSAEGIDCHFRTTAEARTGIWFIALDANGDRTFFTPTGAGSADKLVAPVDVDEALIAQARYLHCGSSSHIRPQGQLALKAAVRAAKAAGVRVSFDPNVRAHLWADPRELRALCEDVLPFCDVVKMAAEETQACIGTSDPEESASRLQNLGVKLACITLGPGGALAKRGADEFRVPAGQVEVVDTTGAGDGFVAGMLSKRARAGAIETLSVDALRAAVGFGCAVGSRVCTRLGAVAALPTAAEAAGL